MVSTVVVNNKGMITIPKEIREKYNIKKGRECSILVLEGVITIVPILTKKELETTRTSTIEEMIRIDDETRSNDLELESK